MAEVARRAGMSALAVAERVQRLERAGVIAGHHLDIDPAAVAPTPTVPADQDLPEQPNAPPRIVPAARRSCERFLGVVMAAAADQRRPGRCDHSLEWWASWPMPNV